MATMNRSQSIQDPSGMVEGNTESRIVRNFIIVSLMAHLLVFFVASLKLTPKPPMISDEWSIDADILSDMPMMAAPQANVLQAQPAPEVKVSEKLLPQLPKHLVPEVETPKEEPIALEKAPEPPQPEKKNEEAPKPIDKPEPPKAITPPTPPDPDKQTLDAAELEKRKKIEALQKAGQTAKDTEAPKANPKIADIIAAANKQGGVTGNGSQVTGSSQAYIDAMKKMVRQRYHLPDVYNFGSAQIEAVFSIVLSEKGDLLQLELAKSSGDAVYDDLTKEAIKQSTPFPPPPPEIAGAEIKLRFTP
jgi:TonB family protein